MGVLHSCVDIPQYFSIIVDKEILVKPNMGEDVHIGKRISNFSSTILPYRCIYLPGLGEVEKDQSFTIISNKHVLISFSLSAILHIIGMF